MMKRANKGMLKSGNGEVRKSANLQMEKCGKAYIQKSASAEIQNGLDGSGAGTSTEEKAGPSLDLHLVHRKRGLPATP